MKVYNVTWTIRAIVSLHSMFNFIKVENPEGAKRVITALVSLGNSLSTLPHRFPLDPILIDEPIPFRFAVKGNYKIIYTIEEDQVMIVEVFDTRRDPNRLVEKVF